MMVIYASFLLGLQLVNPSTTLSWKMDSATEMGMGVERCTSESASLDWAWAPAAFKTPDESQIKKSKLPRKI